MTVLIPSYEPDERLLQLIEDIQLSTSMPIVIVDDGSGEAYQTIFQTAREAGCTVLTHPSNKGKGRALKTGFKYIMDQGEAEGVVCADSDGQHLPADINKIASQIPLHSDAIILGCRRFTGKVPFRSRFGNSVTKVVYALTTGAKVTDTQTGLRGYSVDMLSWLCSVPGERFEYEMNLLLRARSAGYSFHEVEIDTVYLSGNKSSHFRPLMDSIRVYFPILKFSASSMLAGLLDVTLLLLLQFWTGNLFLSTAAARVGSSIVNYSMNRAFVFSKGDGVKANIKSSMLKYFTLVIIVYLCNFSLMHLFFEQLHIPLFIAKLLTEASIFVFSYWAQRQYVYK